MHRYLLLERCKEKSSYYNAPIFLFFGPFFVGGGSATPVQNLLMRPIDSVQIELLMRVKRPSNACSEESSERS